MKLTQRIGFAVMAAAVVAVGAGCGSDDSDTPTDVATTAAPDVSAPPSNVRWQDYQTIALPVADQGPKTNSGSGPVSGFTHDPQGAALAAIQQTVRLSVAPDHQWPGVVAAGVAPGPARDDFAISRQLLSFTAPPAPTEAPKIVGYEVTDYNSDNAAVTVYSSFPDQSFAASQVTVVWSGEDWKLLLPGDDETSGRVSSVDGLPSSAIALAANR